MSVSTWLGRVADARATAPPTVLVGTTYVTENINRSGVLFRSLYPLEPKTPVDIADTESGVPVA